MVGETAPIDTSPTDTAPSDTTPGDTVWSNDAAENAAIETVRAMHRSLAGVLHAVDEARHLEPVGGFVVGR